MAGDERPLVPAGSASEPWRDGEGECWSRCSTGCANCASARSISRGSDVRCSRDHWGLNLVTLNSGILGDRSGMVNVVSSVLTRNGEFDLWCLVHILRKKNRGCVLQVRDVLGKFGF